MLRRSFLKAVGAIGAAGTVSAVDGDLHFLVPKEIEAKRTPLFRVVILFESKPGGKYASCLNALGAAGLDSERIDLIRNPGDFLVTRLSGEINSWGNMPEQTHAYELRRFF